MDGPFLIDTNAFIDLFYGRLPPFEGNRINATLNEEVYYISVITQIELLGYPAEENEVSYLNLVVANAVVLSLDDAVIEATINLRRLEKIKLPDAIIAATALVHNLTLLSRNSKDFERVEGLKFLDSHNF